MVAPYQSQAAYEDTGVVFMARIQDDDGDLLLQSTTTSITLEVTDLSDESSVATVALVVSSVVFDTLQTSDDCAWSIDSVGCNFIYKSVATHLPSPDRSYRFDFLLTPTSGANMVWSYEVPTIKKYVS